MSSRRFNSEVLSKLDSRGFLYQLTDEKALDDLLCSKSNGVVFYIGCDPTAPSLHVGHLLWVKLVNELQNAGLTPIIIMGGATGKIGDPTWKDQQRVMLRLDVIEQNIAAITAKLSTLIRFGDGPNSAILLNNDTWISKLNYMDFLREYGPLFSVNKMLAMDSVSTRLERQQHLSFLEFNYMLLQAYDFLYLFENYECVIQLGGADQWSNMIFGVDLIRRKTGKLAYGVSIPLLTNFNGQKMGKTEQGTVWLDENLTSTFEFWQYWRNVDDRDVAKFLKLFSDMPIEEIDKCESLVGTAGINDMKILLADSVTSFLYPSADLESIKATAGGLFGDGAHGDVQDIETFVAERGSSVCKVLVETALAQSITAAKRLIDGHGVRIDGTVIESYDAIIDHNCLLSAGRKKFVKVTVKEG
ncbi:MAG: tyrosine--tRNA ligase [Holosporales bacterium]|jgi:tyrosyl-tRNA synthetase|nr:tyrosine--tRNA ligase [Holosporales bacterium]